MHYKDELTPSKLTLNSKTASENKGHNQDATIALHPTYSSIYKSKHQEWNAKAPAPLLPHPNTLEIKQLKVYISKN